MDPSVEAVFVPVMILCMLVGMAGVFLFVAKNWIKCPPNQALVTYGRRYLVADAQGRQVVKGYRVITGGGVFRVPLIEQTRTLSLSLFEVPLAIDDGRAADGVSIRAEAVANVKISSEPQRLDAAVERFLEVSPGEMRRMVGNAMEGYLRKVIGASTLEQLTEHRESLSRDLLKLAREELGKMGLECDDFVVQRVSNGTSPNRP